MLCTLNLKKLYHYDINLQKDYLMVRLRSERWNNSGDEHRSLSTAFVIDSFAEIVSFAETVVMAFHFGQFDRMVA